MFAVTWAGVFTIMSLDGSITFTLTPASASICLGSSCWNCKMRTLLRLPVFHIVNSSRKSRQFVNRNAINFEALDSFEFSKRGFRCFRTRNV